MAALETAPFTALRGPPCLPTSCDESLNPGYGLQGSGCSVPCLTFLPIHLFLPSHNRHFCICLKAAELTGADHPRVMGLEVATMETLLTGAETQSFPVEG